MGRLLLLAATLSALPAWADPNDFQIYQLGNPISDPRGNANFKVFAKQLAAAISSVNLAPPETLGHAGFAFSLEAAVVDIKQDGDGVTWPTRAALKGPLLIPSVHIRKGLPYSFELGARVGWVRESRMATGTLELKWALNEGFTYLPDIGVAGRITKLLNSRDFDLTVAGFDLGVGKQFAVAGMMTITPYAGWNLQFVGASSGPVDFNPSRTAEQAEQPSQQFQDIALYQSMQAFANAQSRFYGGLRLIAGAVLIGVEVSYTLIGRFSDPSGDRTVPSVLGGGFTLGLDF